MHSITLAAWEMTTPAPMEKPEKKLAMRKISVPEEVTAAKASAGECNTPAVCQVQPTRALKVATPSMPSAVSPAEFS